MAFLTVQNVIDRLGSKVALELTTDSGSAIDEILIASILAEVHGRIMTYVRQRTQETITQATYPNTLAACSGAEMAIVAYQLHLRRDPVSDDWKKANDEAVAWLTALAEGKVPLPDAELNAGADWGSQEPNAAKIREEW